MITFSKAPAGGFDVEAADADRGTLPGRDDIEDSGSQRSSLRFGARYIADQLRRFGRVDAALAAYNAGPGRAERWLGIAGASGTPEFVAAIDIEETSGYVAAILEHYMHYLMAYAEVP